MLELRALRRRLLLQYLLTVGLLLAAAEGALYGVMRWSGQRELDTLLHKELARVAEAVELGRDRPSIDERETLDWGQQHGPVCYWQVLLEDGRTLGRSRGTPSGAGDLPPLGEEPPPEETQVADAEYGGTPVRAARLRTVRLRKVEKSSRPPRAPAQMTFDLRVALDRTALAEQMGRLGWCLAGGFPVALGLAALGGVFLIRRAVRPVEQAMDRERRFTGAASHELRTPLTALRGEIEVTLRRERSPAEHVAALRRMEGLVGRMTGLVEGLLVLTRARAGHLLLGAGTVSLAKLRQALAEVVRLLPGKERVALTCTAPDETVLPGDSLLLTLAVRNLVENALIHAPESPVRVRLSSAPADELRCDVEDQGPATPPAAPPGLNGAGTGLGLSITRAVVEAHAGRLVLENRPGAGCLATIYLPVATPAVGTPDPK